MRSSLADKTCEKSGQLTFQPLCVSRLTRAYLLTPALAGCQCKNQGCKIGFVEN